EGLLQRGGGVVHRTSKGAGALRAELSHGDVQFFLTAADGFIGADQLFMRQRIQRLKSRELRRRISVGSISRASSNTAADSFLLRLRVYAQIPPPATTTAPPAPANQ